MRLPCSSNEKIFQTPVTVLRSLNSFGSYLVDKINTKYAGYQCFVLCDVFP
jgi:hypothetical protein